MWKAGSLRRRMRWRSNKLDGFEFFFEQLLLIQVRVVAAVLNQLGVGALLGNFTVLDDENLAGVLDGGDAVGDENSGAAAHHGGETGEDALFGERVYAR